MPAVPPRLQHAFQQLLTHAPEVRGMTALEVQLARVGVARALMECEDIGHTRVRASVQRALIVVASELGCAVCGKPIPMRELELHALTRQSLVHLWGNCSDRFAALLGTTVDDALSGDAWLQDSP